MPPPCAKSSHDTYDVLVVGGGPCGLAAAIALGRCGVRTLLVEKHPSTSFHPRGHVVNGRTMEILRTWGLEEAVRARGISHDRNQGVAFVRSVAGEVIGELRTGTSKERNRLVETYGPSAKTSCPQDVLEPVLRWRAAEQMSVDLRFGFHLQTLAQDDTGVTASITAADGTPQVVRASYVIAADGARGRIREQLGIDFGGDGPLGNQMGVYFEADLWPWVAERPNLLWWIFNQQTVGVLIALDGRTRWTYNFGYDATKNCPTDFSHERCEAIVRAAIGVPDLPLQIKDVRVWQMQARIAQRLRAGRVFLAGDAAHPLPPTGGQGMNTAIGDVHNLCWKLSLVVKHLAGDGLLDSYEEERLPIIRFNVEQSVRNARSMEAAGLGGIMKTHEDYREEDIPRMREAIPLQRDHFEYYGQTYGYVYRSQLVVDEGGDAELQEVNTYAASAAPGGRAPHCWLREREGGPTISTIDLFKDDRFTLLAGRDAKDWIAAFSKATSHAGLTARAWMVGPQGDLVDNAGAFHDLYGVSPSGAVLVRPDGHVVWRSHGAHPSPTDVMEQIIERFTAGRLRSAINTKPTGVDHAPVI